MSVVRVVDVGEKAMFDAYFAVAALGGGHDLRLFTNDVNAGLSTGQMEGLDETDFTEATFAGYSAKNLAGGSWTVTESDPTFAEYAQQTFTRSSTGTAQLVRGYYVTLTDDGSLQWYEQFDGPISIEFINDAVRVTPRLSLEDGDVIPVGTISPYGGSGVPTGWLLCNGQAVSRTTFAALFAILGTAYGAGNGTTTFNVPDLRQRFPLGVAASGTGNTRGATGGAIDHTHSLDTATAHAQINLASNVINHNRIATASWTENVSGTTTTSSTADANILGTKLGGSTGTANAPFQTVNYVVKA